MYRAYENSEYHNNSTTNKSEETEKIRPQNRYNSSLNVVTGNSIFPNKSSFSSLLSDGIKETDEVISLNNDGKEMRKKNESQTGTVKQGIKKTDSNQINSKPTEQTNSAANKRLSGKQMINVKEMLGSKK